MLFIYHTKLVHGTKSTLGKGTLLWKTQKTTWLKKIQLIIYGIMKIS